MERLLPQTAACYFLCKDGGKGRVRRVQTGERWWSIFCPASEKTIRQTGRGGDTERSRTRKAPWELQAILSLILFPSPCTLDVSPLGHTVSVSLLFSMHKHKHYSHTKESEGERSREREREARAARHTVQGTSCWGDFVAGLQSNPLLIGLIQYHSFCLFSSRFQRFMWWKWLPQLSQEEI